MLGVVKTLDRCHVISPTTLMTSTGRKALWPHCKIKKLKLRLNGSLAQGCGVRSSAPAVKFLITNITTINITTRARCKGAAFNLTILMRQETQVREEKAPSNYLH